MRIVLKVIDYDGSAGGDQILQPLTKALLPKL